MSVEILVASRFLEDSGVTIGGSGGSASEGRIVAIILEDSIDQRDQNE